jgi:hypothetical protein
VSFLVFHTDNNGAGAGFLKNLREQAPENQAEACRDLASLEKRLRQPRAGLCMLVFFAADKAELNGLTALGSCLGDLPLILVLPDREEGTVIRGHRLYPRFLTFLDCGPGEVCLTAGKMLAAMRAARWKAA